MSVNNYWFFIKTGLYGDVGFGDAYMEGLWDSPDVTALLSFFVANMDNLEKKIGSLRVLNFFTH